MIAKLFVPEGGALHASSGDLSAPSQVQSTGIAPFDEKAWLVTVSDAAGTPRGEAGCEDDLQPGHAVHAIAHAHERTWMPTVFIESS
jgi:hypothetical protein